MGSEAAEAAAVTREVSGAAMPAAPPHVGAITDGPARSGLDQQSNGPAMLNLDRWLFFGCMAV